MVLSKMVDRNLQDIVALQESPTGRDTIKGLKYLFAPEASKTVRPAIELLQNFLHILCN